MSLVKFRRGRWGNLIDSDFFNDDDFLGYRRRRGRLDGPALNIKDTDDILEIELGAPGFSKEDFEVNIENGCLKISAESSSSKAEEENNYTR